jgi:homoserine kinase
MNNIKIFAPATIANLAVGFDQLGLALKEIGDTIDIQLIDSGIEITCSNKKIPTEVEKNTAGAALLKLIELTGYSGGFKVHIEKGIPLGSGLGGSAASAVGAIVGANILLKNKLSKEELLNCALVGESISGAAHYDNITPCLYGGITLISEGEVVSIDNKISNLELIIIHPEVEIKTSEARSILPSNISLQEHIQQSGYLARFINALNTGNKLEFKKSIKDIIIEPVRSKNIPHYNEFKELVSKETYGFSISGSGPTLFSFVQREELDKQINKLKKYQEKTNLSFWYKSVSISNKGSHEIS